MSGNKFTYRYAKISGRLHSTEHLEALRHFHGLLKLNILGEQDQEWRNELEFILSRTTRKIREVEGMLSDTILI